MNKKIYKHSIIFSKKNNVKTEKIKKFYYALHTLSKNGKYTKALRLAEKIENGKTRKQVIKDINKAYEQTLIETISFLSSMENKGIKIDEFKDFMYKAKGERYLLKKKHYKNIEDVAYLVMELIKEKKEIIDNIKEIARK